MSYDEVIEALYLSMREMKPTLSRFSEYGFAVAKKLEDHLGTPSKNIKFVHIAGTNGKGSVAFKIAETLRKAGLKVGLFTSPHLTTFRERIQINGSYVSKEDFARLGTIVMQAAKTLGVEPIFFEYLFVMSLCYFSEKKVDVAVIETGVGGRIDTTNLITPILSVITSIGLDHVPFLGNTLEDIACEKAGIIKKNVPCVLGPSAQINTIINIAKARKAPLIFSMMSGGFFDDENMDIAAVALKELSKTFHVTDDHICAGVRARPNGRFEIFPSFTLKKCGFKESPEFVVLDVAHNLDALKRLHESIQLKLPAKKLRFFLSLASHKEDLDYLKYLSEIAEHIYLADSDHFKLLKPQKLKESLKEVGYNQVTCGNDFNECFQLAVKETAAFDQLLIVCGTFYIMGPIRSLLGQSEQGDKVLTQEVLESLQKMSYKSATLSSDNVKSKS